MRALCLFSKGTNTLVSSVFCVAARLIPSFVMKMNTNAAKVHELLGALFMWRNDIRARSPQIKSVRTLPVRLMFYSTTLFHYPRTARAPA
jgi:hypothetical protein